MTVYTDYTDACPKCMGKDLSRIDSDCCGMVYWEKYHCNGCGYEFVDQFRYECTYDEEGDGD